MVFVEQFDALVTAPESRLAGEVRLDVHDGLAAAVVYDRFGSPEEHAKHAQERQGGQADDDPHRLALAPRAVPVVAAAVAKAPGGALNAACVRGAGRVVEGEA